MTVTTDQLIFIDWKFVGSDYLQFFVDNYPDLAFLQSEAFEALSDELANELPETCFEALSQFLAQYGYELWNLDQGGDDYTLALVVAGQGAALTRDHPINLEDGTPYDSYRLAPNPLEPAKPVAIAKPKPKSVIIEATDIHADHNIFLNEAIRYRCVTFADDAGTFQELVDLHTFPLEPIVADAFWKMQDGKDHLSPIYATSNGQYWEWQKPQKRQKLHENYVRSIAFISDHVDLDIAEIEGTLLPAGAIGNRVGKGEALFYSVLCQHDVTLFDPLLPQLASPIASFSDAVALKRIHGKTVDYIGNYKIGDVVLPLSETSIAIFSHELEVGNDGPQCTICYLYDTASKTKGATVRLPFLMTSEPFALNSKEVIFVRVEGVPHPDYSPIIEQTAWLVRLNLETGHWADAELTGLRNDYNFNAEMRAKMPAQNHKIRSFDGSVQFSAGHENWYILNYFTSYPGKHDLAWIWNCETNDVFMIDQKCFPRRTPSIYYHSHLKRYIADDSYRVDLLVAFEGIRETCQKGKLVWSDPQSGVS